MKDMGYPRIFTSGLAPIKNTTEKLSNVWKIKAADFCVNLYKKFWLSLNWLTLSLKFYQNVIKNRLLLSRIRIPALSHCINMYKKVWLSVHWITFYCNSQGLFLCTWRLFNNQISGIYVEMEFLDAVFNYGQVIYQNINVTLKSLLI